MSVIVGLKVKAGDTVKEGEAVATLSAMKKWRDLHLANGV
jgi:biotin carboxyl carrier protein